MKTRGWLGLLIMMGALPLPAEWNNPPRRADRDIQHGTFLSPSLNTRVGYNVLLPPQYSSNPASRFPVIYYLHGYQGNESSYLEYARHAREAWKSGEPFILVFVNGGETSFFTDSPDRSVPGESVVVKELIPHIDEKFRTRAGRGGRSLHGYSMGGYGALKLAFKFPDRFGSVVSYGATISDEAEFRKHLKKVFQRQFGNDPRRFTENDPVALAERNAERIRGQTAIRVVVGTRDEFLPRHRALRQTLERLKIGHEYEEIRGAKHDKEDLYKSAAVRGFEFSMRHFNER